MPDRVKVWIVKYEKRRFLSLQWKDHATGRVRMQSARTADQAEAEGLARDLEYKLTHGLYAEPNRMPWETFRELYEEERLSGNKPNTQLKAESIFNAFEKLMTPGVLGNISERTLSQYRAKLREKGYKAPTICGHLAYLKSALRWAKNQKLITEVPKFDMPKIAKGSNRVKIKAAGRITGEEFERLLMKCPSDGWRVLLALAWHCGLRRNEARDVRGEHVDLAARQIAIPNNKAGDEAATVFITPELDGFLRQHWPEGKLPSGTLAAGVTLDPNELSKQFARIARRAAVQGSGKDGYCTLHDLRRSFGSRWAAKAPAQVLQRLMRHSDIAVTLSFYADVDKAALTLLWPTTGLPSALSSAKQLEANR